ncbi:DUF4136 domain-containing protein [Gaetbulibacter saemankumensis]|uniref:DUF4136 domain-containing protein n=1 Tax=Gaetbulibacter saemankumensis TaxID=311208 RepID=UPI0004888D9A|nr:DUF4136 domain-containing protein [Gaetbulibacter saemankumensis]
MKYYQFVALLFLVSYSCAPIRVTYDYDREADFSKYKTYNYYSDMSTGLSELDTKRLLDALDKTLANQGFLISSTPDFFIDIKSHEYKESPRSRMNVGLGGSGRNLGGGVSIGVPVGQSNINRMITFEFVDENIKQLFWQAISEASYGPNATPEQRETLFEAIVLKVLSGYPPK